MCAVAARVAVIGADGGDMSCSPGADPVGQTIRVRNLPFRVIGVLAAKGQSQWGQDQDDTVLIPYTTAMKKLLATHVPADSVRFRTSQQATFEARGADRRRFCGSGTTSAPGQEDDFTVRNLTDVAETAQATTRVMTMLLGGIAGVSLLVGGIGIMNIMLVSVTERTREIGIRMAVGARSKHVRTQFLIESLVLGLAGGLAGIALGVGLSALTSHVFGWPVITSPDGSGRIGAVLDDDRRVLRILSGSEGRRTRSHRGIAVRVKKWAPDPGPEWEENN